MKLIMCLFYILILVYGNTIYACSIKDGKNVEIGASNGIEGVCSNNKLPISCEYLGNDEISCDGPGGGYSGYDLESVVFSACGCSSEDENEKKLLEELHEGAT